MDHRATYSYLNACSVSKEAGPQFPRGLLRGFVDEWLQSSEASEIRTLLADAGLKSPEEAFGCDTRSMLFLGGNLWPRFDWITPETQRFQGRGGLRGRLMARRASRAIR